MDRLEALMKKITELEARVSELEIQAGVPRNVAADKVGTNDDPNVEWDTHTGVITLKAPPYWHGSTY